MAKKEDRSKAKEEKKPEAQPKPPVPPTPPTPPTSQTGILAVLSVVFGALGLVSNGTFGVVGLVLGIIELNNIKKGKSPESGKTLAIIGIILGSFNLVLLVVGVILAVFFGASFCGCGLCSAWFSALSEGARSIP